MLSVYFILFFTNIDCIFFSVIESHPDSVHEDLRLTRPFSRLVEYCNSLDMETMTQKASVINWGLIMMHILVSQREPQFINLGFMMVYGV